MPACKVLYGLLLVAAANMPGRLWSQSFNEDSIKKVIAQSKVDTARIEAMLTYGNYLMRQGMDSAAFALLNEGKTLAEKTGHAESIAWAYFNLGSYYRSQGEWEKSIE